MRVSEEFNLGRTQPSLEFVDVDVCGDTPVYVDPRALRSIESPNLSKAEFRRVLMWSAPSRC
jgi:hypothetical protein